MEEISINEKTTTVGVYVTKKCIPKMMKQRPHQRLKMLAEVNKTAQVDLYFFSIKDIDVRNKSINGTYFDEEKHRWQKKSFSYPDVLYKRGGSDISGKAQRKKEVIFLKQLKELGVQPLNYQTGFNKWRMIQKLHRYSTISPHIPNTVKLSSPSEIDEMLKKHSKVYIKACKGRRGKQVMRVSKKIDGTYEYRYYNNQLFIGTMNHLDKLMEFVYRSFGVKNLIVQQAINLLEVNDSVVDFRAEIQRNGDGKLEIVAIPVRISQKKAPITTHASSYQFEQFFKIFLNYSDKEIANKKEQINHFLINVYQSIEQEYGQIGELGIDFAIDKEDKIWFIEANSQSAKVSLMKAYDAMNVEKAFLNPLEYAKFLQLSK